MTLDCGKRGYVRCWQADFEQDSVTLLRIWKDGDVDVLEIPLDVIRRIAKETK